MNTSKNRKFMDYICSNSGNETKKGCRETTTTLFLSVKEINLIIYFLQQTMSDLQH